MKLLNSVVLGTAFLGSALLSTAVFAHTLTVVPSHFVQSKTGGFITVDLSATNMTFQADKGIGVDGFQVYLPDGSTAKPTAVFQGKRKSLADVELATDGTYRLENGGAARYFTSYELNGERKRLMGDKQKAAKELPKGAQKVVTTQGRNRAFAFVTVNQPTATVVTPTGQGLEFKMDRHPADVVAGELVTMTLLVDGKPAAGVELDLSRDGELYRNEPGRVHHTTDQTGQFTFTAPEAGRYLLEAAFEANSKNDKADKVREAFTWTFEVALP
jgi:uncharacterized GH25 family protein